MHDDMDSLNPAIKDQLTDLEKILVKTQEVVETKGKVCIFHNELRVEYRIINVRVHSFFCGVYLLMCYPCSYMSGFV